MVKDSLNILLAGDSFAAKWPNGESGWPNLLAIKHKLTNVANPGIGEYKILKQIENSNVSKFDLVIVCHTSPYRVHTPQHPLHKNGFHKNCDLIFADLENNNDSTNKSLTTAQDWFKYHFDEDYQNRIYKLMRDEINRLITVQYISIDNLANTINFGNEKNQIDFSNYWPKHRGNVNHYTAEGNQYVVNTIQEKISEIMDT
jgi:hypothetical protein